MLNKPFIPQVYLPSNKGNILDIKVIKIIKLFFPCFFKSEWFFCVRLQMSIMNE